MFWDDLVFVTDAVRQYGFKGPLVDLGGQAVPILADYRQTLATGDQDARFVRLTHRPFDHIDPDYVILNPEKGDPFIEQLDAPNAYGTVVCLSVLEHVENPFNVFAGFYKILTAYGLLIVSTVFEYPLHGEHDWWRFSPECLVHLAKSVGLRPLWSGFRLDIREGIERNGENQVIRSVGLVASKGPLELGDREKCAARLPTQYANGRKP